jgi:hypothetical protein
VVPTTPPPVTTPPRRPPPTTVHHPAPAHHATAPGHAPIVTAAKPPTRTQILWSAAALPLPFASSPLSIGATSQPKTTLAALMLPAKPSAASTRRASAPHREPTTTSSRQHDTPQSRAIRGSAASVTTSTSSRSALGPLLLGVLIGDILLGAAAAVGAVRMIVRRRNPRTPFQ